MNLTIVTIGYKNNLDSILAYNSYNNLLCDKYKAIIQDGGGTFKKNDYPKAVVYSEIDDGIFDALNKAIEKIETKYFMLVHSGDQLLINKTQLDDRIILMESKKLDLLLGSQMIDTGSYNRLHSVKSWFPWQLKLGVQPPHMPTIYRTDFVKSINYDKEYKVIGDFKYFQDIFKMKPRWAKYTKSIVIQMGPGGNTSSGIKSLLLVSSEFRKHYPGISGIVKSIFRVPFKIISTIY